jgi:hypothetical protein
MPRDFNLNHHGSQNLAFALAIGLGISVLVSVSVSSVVVLLKQSVAIQKRRAKTRRQ